MFVGLSFSQEKEVPLLKCFYNGIEKRVIYRDDNEIIFSIKDTLNVKDTIRIEFQDSRFFPDLPMIIDVKAKWNENFSETIEKNFDYPTRSIYITGEEFIEYITNSFSILFSYKINGVDYGFGLQRSKHWHINE